MSTMVIFKGQVPALGGKCPTFNSDDISQFRRSYAVRCQGPNERRRNFSVVSEALCIMQQRRAHFFVTKRYTQNILFPANHAQ